ncbi:hypothetical protein [Okeania sp. KiyG1]|uniref:hypothetical protein n=1 Tax=Okeania sp. KiyG1 TaxID=2720165 RepID=UPI001922D448|nr:hypothetical protein [Okeania sp. KiyG1]GGA40404.1 hypothetical protein CYANOKiyG1_58640 [Okeania sp. KiyG1]
MAWHLPIAGAAGLVVGLIKTCADLEEGKSLGDSLMGGLDVGLKASTTVATLGLVSPDAGIDIGGPDGVCYDPDGSCRKDV